MDRRSIPAGMIFDTWRAADGWPLRRFDWPAAKPARGNLLFLGGRGDFVEKYLEALGHWHDRGWSVTGFDWRGQGGSGRYLADPLICHIPDFDPLLSDLEMFVDEWAVANRGPLAIIAHSMGAQIALRLLARRDAPIDGAVLLSPMLDIRPLPASIAGPIASAAMLRGRGEARIWRRDLGNHNGRMTSCPVRQQDKMWWKAARPDIASGAPSWGWLKAACASIAALNGSDLERIETPLMMLASRRDPVIGIEKLRRAAARSPQAALHLWDGKGHELLREADGVRIPVFRAIDSFLDRVGVSMTSAVTSHHSSSRA